MKLSSTLTLIKITLFFHELLLLRTTLDSETFLFSNFVLMSTQILGYGEFVTDRNFEMMFTNLVIGTKDFER